MFGDGLYQVIKAETMHPKDMVFTQQSLKKGTGSALKSNPLPFCTPLLTKRYPFHIPATDKWYPFHIPTILDKSPRDSSAIFLIFCHFSGFPLKTVHHFRNFLAVLHSPTLYKVETLKKFWIHASNIVCGERGGVGPV